MPKNSFIPEKLPIKINYESLVADIGKATYSLARLDTLLSQLPNPKLISRALITKEAVLSSKIEGTQATLNDVFEFEAKGEKEELSNTGKDVREIINYRAALEKGVELLESGRPLSENLIKELHGILLHSVRGHNRAPGEFRKCQVFIGPPGASIENANFIPPPPNQIVELFSNLEKYLNSDDEKDKLVQIAIGHYQFEAIHPFVDGNGRMGRLLITLFLFNKGILTKPFLYVSEFFEEHRQDYYDLLRGVSEKGDWQSWILFFLRALDSQAKKVQKVSQDILDLYHREKEKMDEMNSMYAQSLLDAIFIQPIFTSRNIRARTHIKNTQTLFNLINKFVRAGIIIDLRPGNKRNKVYGFNRLLILLRG